MKKFLLLAFAACLTFAAQSVTLAWAKGAGESVDDATIVNGGSGLSQSCSFAFVLSFNTSDVSANIDEIARFGQWNGGNTYLKLWSGNDDFGYTGTFGNSKGSSDVGNTLKTRDSLLFVMTYENVGDKILVNGWIDGQQVYTNVVSNNMDGLTVWVNDKDNKDVYSLVDATAYNGALTADEIATMAANNTSNIFSVPEPTALALLALGVAGLALRRKMA